MAKRLSKKQIDKQIAFFFHAECSGIQINVMDIGKIFDAGRLAAANGGDIREAVLASVAAVRQN